MDGPNVVVNTSTGFDFWHATNGSGLIDDVFDNNTIVNAWNCGVCFDAGAHSGTLLRNNLVVPRSGTVTSGAAAGIDAISNLFTCRGALSFAARDARRLHSLPVPEHHGDVHRA